MKHHLLYINVVCLDLNAVVQFITGSQSTAGSIMVSFSRDVDDAISANTCSRPLTLSTDIPIKLFSIQPSARMRPEGYSSPSVINPQRACAQRVTVVLVSFIHSFVRSFCHSVCQQALLEGRNQPGSESGIKQQYFTK